MWFPQNRSHEWSLSNGKSAVETGQETQSTWRRVTFVAFFVAWPSACSLFLKGFQLCDWGVDVCVCVCMSVSVCCVCVCPSCFLKFTTAILGNLWNKTLQILKYLKIFHVPNCFAQDSSILVNVLTGCPSTKKLVFQNNHLSLISCFSNFPSANQGESE